MTSPPALDATIHSPVRLQLSALLAEVDEMEFGTARDTLGISDSLLSKHVSHLEAAGYVTLRKAALAGRQRTWLSITRQGKAAFRAHVEALMQLVKNPNRSSTKR